MNMNFGKLKYTEEEGGGTVVHSFSEVREREYFAYLRSLSDSGYTKREEYSLGTSSVAIFEKSGDMIHTVYFPEIREARVTSAHLSFSDFPTEDL